MLSFNSKPSSMVKNDYCKARTFPSRQNSMEQVNARVARFGSSSPVPQRQRAYYAKAVNVREVPNSSLPMTARPAPVQIVKSPTPQIISWKHAREASPLVISRRPESSNGSLTIQKVPLWRQAPGMTAGGNFEEMYGSGGQILQATPPVSDE
jgi:hypothetical protein